MAGRAGKVAILFCNIYVVIVVIFVAVAAVAVVAVIVATVAFMALVCLQGGRADQTATPTQRQTQTEIHADRHIH